MAFVRPSNDSGSGQGRVIDNGDLRDAEIISEILNTRGLSKLNLLLELTRQPGGVTAIDFCIETSVDGVRFYPVQQVDETTPPLWNALEDKIDRLRIVEDGTKTASVTIDVVAPFMRFRLEPSGGVEGDVINLDAYGLA